MSPKSGKTLAMKGIIQNSWKPKEAGIRKMAKIRIDPRLRLAA